MDSVCIVLSVVVIIFVILESYLDLIFLHASSYIPERSSVLMCWIQFSKHLGFWFNSSSKWTLSIFSILQPWFNHSKKVIWTLFRYMDAY